MLTEAFWNVAGAAWYTGHVNYAVRGYSSLSLDEIWNLSREWVKGKIRGKGA